MIKKVIKKILIRVVKPLANRLSLIPVSVHREIQDEFAKNQLLTSFFSTLKEAGFTPRHIMDVGANHGTWSRFAYNFFPEATYSLIEPQSSLEQSLLDILQKNPNNKLCLCGAGNQSGELTFTIADRDDSSSFAYTEQQAKELGYEQKTVPIKTINDIIDQEKLTIPDLIKIDAEGLDLEVLEGASNCHGKTEVFLVEAAVVRPDIKNHIATVISYMESKGYVLIDITDLNRPWKTQVLWLVELAFVKKDGIVSKFAKNVLLN